MHGQLIFFTLNSRDYHCVFIYSNVLYLPSVCLIELKCKELFYALVFPAGAPQFSPAGKAASFFQCEQPQKIKWCGSYGMKQKLRWSGEENHSL